MIVVSVVILFQKFDDRFDGNLDCRCNHDQKDAEIEHCAPVYERECLAHLSNSGNRSVQKFCNEDNEQEVPEQIHRKATFLFRVTVIVRVGWR